MYLALFAGLHGFFEGKKHNMVTTGFSSDKI
jgi:hypothetical protein